MGRWAAIFVCPRSNFNIFLPIFSKLSTNVEDHKISAQYDNQGNHISNSRVMALGIQILLDKLLVSVFTSIFFDQSSLNFLQMLRTIKSRPSMITSGIASVTQELQPLI